MYLFKPSLVPIHIYPLLSWYIVWAFDCDSPFSIVICLKFICSCASDILVRVIIKNTDTYTLKNYLDNIYTIEASNNIEFAQNFIYEFYFDQIEALPWEISYSIDYETLYKKLEMTMNITKNEYENIYYYSNN